jgi:pSer/pThr/pTyr-binding forkhead associated (FHA) protein
MILRLQHQRPDGEVDSYYLKPGRRYHIGRGSGCEIRILDLKLSRKHCALEFSGNHWQVVDLLSTNGCTLNGEQIVGTIQVAKGGVIAAGSTSMTVDDIFPAEMVPVINSRTNINESAGEADTEAVTPDSAESDDSAHLEQMSLPEGPSDQAAKNEAQHHSGNEWEPEPGSDALTKTDALVPHPGIKLKAAALRTEEPRRPTAVFRAADLNHDEEATKLHTPAYAAPIAAASAPVPAPTTTPTSDSIERTFYITVLGRRVGPLTRSVARDLKARELKGTLTTADLEQYPLG